MRRITLRRLVLALILINGCLFLRSWWSIPTINEKTDSAFTVFTDHFGRVYNREVKTPIVFDDLKGKGHQVIAECEWWSDNTKIIRVRHFYWDKFDYFTREQLIFHELGHCEFNIMKHNDEVKDTCPASIMRSFIFEPYEIANCYIPQHDYYLRELLAEANSINSLYKKLFYNFLSYPRVVE